MEPECTREKAVDATGIETYWIGSKAAVTYQGAGANIFYKVISCKNSHILKWMEKKHGYNVLGEHINWKYVKELYYQDSQRRSTSAPDICQNPFVCVVLEALGRKASCLGGAKKN